MRSKQMRLRKRIHRTNFLRKQTNVFMIIKLFLFRMHNYKLKLYSRKGFVKRTKDEKGKDETKKNLKLDSPSTQKFNSNLTNRADMVDQGEDESDLSD